MTFQSMPVQALHLQVVAVKAIPQHGGHRFRDFTIIILLVVIAKLVFFS
jgi:hypothetical protein